MVYSKNLYKFREQMHRWDSKNVMDYAIKEAVEKTVAEKEKEKATALKELSKMTAKRLKGKGLTARDISDATGLSIEEIEKL